VSIRVLIADDQALIRAGFRMLLNGESDLEVVGEAENGVQAIERARLLKPDVVLMDLLMPAMGGIEATERLRAELPETEVVAMTSVLEDAAVVGAVRAGAIGYLLKDTDAEALCTAIKAAAAGQVQLAPEAAARLMREVRAPAPKAEAEGQALTERETEVLRLLARGRANKEIAADLNIGEKTVKTHVSNVLAKLGLQSRTQAALVAVRMGLVDPDEVGGGNR
jgi:two-component system, NarL family, response regulator LiaR